MEKNGESDTNSMILDPVSPGSSNSRDMLDEPTAPRRNSTDDNDTTRPRKRPAVMAGSEELREANPATSPQLRYSDPIDGGEPRVKEPTSHKSTVLSQAASRTLHIRVPQTQTEEEVRGAQIQQGMKSEDVRKRLLPESPELSHLADDDSDTNTLRSTSPDVEEVEMDVNDHLSYHIKQMEPGIDPSSVMDEYDDASEALARIAAALEKSECPTQELREISDRIVQFTSSASTNLDQFEQQTTSNELCDSLPALVGALLAREEPFHLGFYQRDGLGLVTRFFADFVRLAALLIHHEALKLSGLPPEIEILLFSEAYLSAINSMLRQAPLYQTISHAGFQILDTFPHVICAFVGPEGFLSALTSLAEAVYRRTPLQPRLSSQLSHLHELPLQILRALQILPATSTEARSKILSSITQFWTVLETAISDILDSHIQAVDVKELLGRLDTFGLLAATIHALQPMNSHLSPKLRKYLSSNSLAVLKSKDIAQIVAWAHKFPFFYKMLCTSRMDVRLRGLTCMTDTLLTVWREYHTRAGEGDPILSFLVNFLIENKVLEYIVGPESHSELINRSANVPAFLIVNKKITDHLLDCLWQPVLDNKDPRIVKATLKMHQEMLSTMTTDNLYSLSRRVSRVPFASFDSFLMNFVGFLVDRISKAYLTEPRQRGETEISKLGPAPYEMLIRLMRLSSEHDDNTQSLDIFEKANEQLTALAEFGPEDSARRRILEQCVQDIRVMNGSVTGSCSVILAFLRRRPRNHRSGSPTAADIEYLVENFDLAALVVCELVEFVNRHRTVKSVSRLRQLKIRLELLSLILRFLPQCLSKDSHAQLWSYLVGEKALGSSERNLGFDFYNGFGSADMEAHPILDSVYRDFFPALDCTDISYSPSVIELCKRSLEYLNRETQKEASGDANDKVLHISGAEQLWRIILDARDEILASATVSFLVQVYLDSNMIRQSDPEVIEATHDNIVVRCIQLLTSSAVKLSELCTSKNDETTADDNSMSPGECRVTRQYHRALDLLDQLIKGFRTHPFYASAIPDEPSAVKGDMVEITLRLQYSTGPTTTHSVQLGCQNTGYDLHSHIYRHVSAKHRIILSGRELNLADEPTKMLKDFGIQDKCIVTVYIQEAVIPPGTAKHNIRQPQIMQHFEALYPLLGLPEALSVKAWYFLVNFPPDESVRRRLRDSETSTLEIFPPDKPYKTLYSLYALRHCFEDTHASDEDRRPLLRICVRRLCEALATSTMERPDQKAETQVIVTKDLLRCLRHLLQTSKESRGDDILPHPESFVDCLLLLLRRFLEPPYAGLVGVDTCVVDALYVLFRSCYMHPQIWSQALKGSTLQELVQVFLVDDSRPVVRQCMSDSIDALCAEPPCPNEFAQHFWPILSDILSNGHRLDPEFSEQLFHTASTVFEFLGASGLQLSELQTFFRDWSFQLSNHSVNEIVGQPKEDNVIIGFTRLLSHCMRLLCSQGVAPSTDQLAETWQTLLFPDPTYESSTGAERIPCLHDSSRAELYRFTLDLVANHQESLNQIAKLNNILFSEDGILCDEYWVDRDRWLRAPTGLVGLTNLSNTCYLNSLLTQLFMNRSFMDFILRLPVGPADQTHRSSYCLKALFARMQYSFAKAIEPRDLVESLRDFAGDPIDPHVQMDVDEFFNLLFDRLESEMPSAELKSTFRSYYGGHLVQQVKSNECPHISERTEPFSAIQCDIKGKHTLEESLKAYVEGEIMEGDNKYRCTTCDRLVDAVKRTCLKDIPDHLICHLKRFDFDLQTMHRSKINDRFEFPTKLDMRPYTIDHLTSTESGTETPSNHDIFELVGVLVHTGTAESGHYYSYIRDRLSPAENPSWLEYNDSEVSVFDPSTIPENCYGGSDNVSATGYIIPKSFSAYMLFYQRSSSLQKFRKSPSDTQPKPSVPADLRVEILRENEELIKRHCMFSNEYVAFVKALVDAQSRMLTKSNGSGEEVLWLSLRAFEQICSRVKDFPVCDDLVSSIQVLACQEETCSKVFSQWASDPNVITALILDNPFPDIRRHFGRMLITVLAHLRQTNWTLYGTSGTTCDDNDSQRLRKQTVLYRVCRGFSESWSGLQTSLKPWNDFFGILIEICSWGDDEKDYMLKAGILRRLLEMIVVECLSPARRADSNIENFVKLMNKPRVPGARPAELLYLLMTRCSPYLQPCHNEEARDRLRQNVRRPLTKLEDSYFKLMPPRAGHILAVYSKLLEIPGTVSAMERLTLDMVGDEAAPVEHDLLGVLKHTLLSGISVDPAVHATPYLHCLRAFVAATKSQNYITDIIYKVSEEIPTIGMTGGGEHLQFFQSLWSLDEPGRVVKVHMLDCISSWAPALVVYHDPPVRDAAEDFICELLFDHPQLPLQNIRRAVVNLANGLFQFIRTKFPQNRQPLDENTFVSAMSILAKCKEVFAKGEEDQFNARLEELKLFTDRIVEEEEDIDVASDEWGGASDFGSDTRDANHAEEFR